MQVNLQRWTCWEKNGLEVEAKRRTLLVHNAGVNDQWPFMEVRGGRHCEGMEFFWFSELCCEGVEVKERLAELLDPESFLKLMLCSSRSGIHVTELSLLCGGLPVQDDEAIHIPFTGCEGFLDMACWALSDKKDTRYVQCFDLSSCQLEPLNHWGIPPGADQMASFSWFRACGDPCFEMRSFPAE